MLLIFAVACSIVILINLLKKGHLIYLFPITFKQNSKTKSNTKTPKMFVLTLLNLRIVLKYFQMILLSFVYKWIILLQIMRLFNFFKYFFETLPCLERSSGLYKIDTVIKRSILTYTQIKESIFKIFKMMNMSIPNFLSSNQE